VRLATEPGTPARLQRRHGSATPLHYDRQHQGHQARPLFPPDFMLEPRIQQHFFESADLSYQAAETLAHPIAEAAHHIVDCITSGGRLWVHGRGAALAPATLLGAALCGRFERERPGLAAWVLGTDAVTLSDAQGMADAEPPSVQQLRVLGQPGDLLVAFTLRPDDALLATMVHAAHEREMSVIIIAGREGPPGTGQGALVHIAETDLWLTVPHDRAARICELQLVLLHAMCDAVDLQLLGDADLP